VNIFDTLRVDVNVPTELRGQAFDLFDDAKFRSVATIEKGRNYRETQAKPSWRSGCGPGPWRRMPAHEEKVLADETGCLLQTRPLVARERRVGRDRWRCKTFVSR
jgi:hypothetical protein